MHISVRTYAHSRSEAVVSDHSQGFASPQRADPTEIKVKTGPDVGGRGRNFHVAYSYTPAVFGLLTFGGFWLTVPGSVTALWPQMWRAAVAADLSKLSLAC